MELKDIASVSGKGGLYRIVSPTKSGVILESMDESKSKLVASSNQRISILSEISIYTNSKEGSTPLLEVFQKIKKDFGDDPGVDAESDGAELKSFLQSVLPEFDESRVYVSDIKKLVRWYGIVLKQAPEAFEGVKKDKVKTSEDANEGLKKND
jgi:hypothetical protein